MSLAKRVKELWEAMPATPSAMMRHVDYPAFEEADRQEALSLLPPLEGANVVDLACGIGRFTRELARRSAHVTAVEFVPEFLEKNRQDHESCGNIDFVLADARDVSFKKGSVQFVFVNWLLLYFEDEEIASLLAKIDDWLDVDGKVFFRESCSPVYVPPTSDNPTHYRTRAFYEEIFQRRFHLLQKGNFVSWLEFKNQPFSCYWLVAKRGAL